MNITTQLSFELAYYDVAVQHVNLYSMRTPPLCKYHVYMYYVRKYYVCIHPVLYLAITQEYCEQYWTSLGGNTPQGTNYTATFLPSRKLSKLDEPDMQDTAGEAGMSS